MKCARLTCLIEFTPRDSRQRYHDPECKQKAYVERRELECLNCRHLEAVSTHGRFCSAPCEQSYRERKRPGRRPRSFVPVIVLLPAGCNPIRTMSTLAAPESTERIGGVQAYGEVVRRIWCARYERCLSHAVSKNWSGFNCSSCEVDESTAPEPGENKKGGNWSW